MLIKLKDKKEKQMNKEIERIIAYQARRFLIKFPYSAGLEVEDLMQEGFIVELEAKETYNPERRANYNTYLTKCLHNFYTNLLINSYTQKNLTFLKPIEELEEVSGSFCRDLQEVELEMDLPKLRQELSPLAQQVFDCYVWPDLGFINSLVKEVEFRNAMYDKGYCSQFNPRTTHTLVADYLGTTNLKVGQSVNEIKETVSQYII